MAYYLLDFSAEEKKKYLVLEKEAKGLLDRINQGEDKGYSFILELLLRMRQFSVRNPYLSQRADCRIIGLYVTND